MQSIALLEKLASREFTALEVTTAFCKRAAIAQQLTCCLTETFFDIAISRVNELDEHVGATGKPMAHFMGSRSASRTHSASPESPHHWALALF